MKNYDIIRDVLLYLEKNPMKGGLLLDKLENYSEKEIEYTTNSLVDGGFINYEYKNMQGNYLISNLSYRGYELLDNIRNDDIWRKTLDIISKYDSVSLSILEQVAYRVTYESLN